MNYYSTCFSRLLCSQQALKIPAFLCLHLRWHLFPETFCSSTENDTNLISFQRNLGGRGKTNISWQNISLLNKILNNSGIFFPEVSPPRSWICYIIAPIFCSCHCDNKWYQHHKNGHDPFHFPTTANDVFSLSVFLLDNCFTRSENYSSPLDCISFQYDKNQQTRCMSSGNCS